MGVFGDNTQRENNWVFAPKEGEAPVKYVVTGGLERIETKSQKVSYKDKNNNLMGYFDLLEVDGDKKLLISTWQLYFALKECDPEIGEEITISHPSRGKYIVTK